MKLNLPNAVPEFVGLSNYIRMFTDEALHVGTLNTLLFAVVSVTLEYWWGYLLLWRFARIVFGQARNIDLFDPDDHGSGCCPVWMMLDSTTGIINYLLSFLGIPSITWLSSTERRCFAVILVNVWQLAPWVRSHLCAKLKALPQDSPGGSMCGRSLNGTIFRKIIAVRGTLLTIVVMLRLWTHLKEC